MPIMKFHKPLIYGFLFLLILSSCSKTPKQKTTEFKKEDALEVRTIDGNYYIAIAAPLTGPYRELGNTIIEGSSLAVEEYNAKQKDSKNKIGTIIIDDGGMVSEGIARADIVIAEEALGVIGHLNSEISIETSTKYSKNKIAQISPASTNPILTERQAVKGFVYRTIGTDRQLAKAALKYISDHPEIKTVAVLYNDRVYGKSVASEFDKKAAKHPEIEIVMSHAIPVRTANHRKTAIEVSKFNPDLIFFIGEYNDAAYLLKDIRKLMPESKFLGAEGVHQQQFINIAGEDAENSLVIGSKAASDELAKRYETRFGKPISGYVSSSYEATNILIEAIEASHFNKSSQAIAQTLAKNKIFNPNGDLLNPDFVIYQVKDARFVPVKTVELGNSAKTK